MQKVGLCKPVSKFGTKVAGTKIQTDADRRLHTEYHKLLCPHMFCLGREALGTCSPAMRWWCLHNVKESVTMFSWVLRLC